MRDDAEEARLASLAVEAVRSSLDLMAPRLPIEAAEHLEHWLLGLAMHLYWKLSGRGWDHPGMNLFYGRLSDLAVDAHHRRFGGFREDDDGHNPEAVFRGDITEYYDCACDVVAEVEERGLAALHNVLREKDVWPSDWRQDEQLIGSLASTMIFESALKETA